ncbi:MULTISPECIES: hypothetical protein [Flavobacterium]|uniref:YARHG domain-containing protein n=1 Tax=Flavobacterium jumunjinense TaxID=998845 RepID=A0ABV5GKC9_9FLAO|nr:MULTISPECIES: hypothetical protein [Flavobacterium]
MTNIKNSLYIFFLLSFNLIYSKNYQENPSVKTIVEYIVDNQKKIFGKKDEIYTDSICVKDFNFTNFKYSNKTSFENRNGFKLYFVDKILKKVSFTHNKKIINLNILDYENFKLIVSNFIRYDVIVNDIVNEKSFYFNFEYNTIKYYADDIDLRIEIADLKRILLLDGKLNPLSTLYIENFELSNSSKFFYYQDKIYEEIVIVKKNARCSELYNIKYINFSDLYLMLKNPFGSYCEVFNRYQIEITKGNPDIFFWFLYYRQKEIDIPDTSLHKNN